MKKLNPNEYIGKIYGQLTIIEYIEYEKGCHFFLAKCNCKTQTIKQYRLSDLKNKKKGIKTCGICNKGKHNKSNTRLYRIWKNMKNRCYNINNSEYDCYGGKGIKVCNNWVQDFMNFYNWAINNNYNDTMTIDRINNDGNYEPSNCQWLTRSENSTKSNNERVYKSKRIVKGISENDEIYYFDNIRKFAREYDLDNASIVKVCKGISEHHKNWVFTYID